MTTRPPAIIAIGRNYADHAAEMGGAPDAHPTVFMKNPASVIGDGEPIILPPICSEPGEQVDFEGELAVIIDRDARDVPRASALPQVPPSTLRALDVSSAASTLIATSRSISG